MVVVRKIYRVHYPGSVVTSTDTITENLAYTLEQYSGPGGGAN